MVRTVREESGAWLLLKKAVVRATPRAMSSLAGLALACRNSATGRPVRSTMAMVAVSPASAVAAALTISFASAFEMALNGSGVPRPIAPSVQTSGRAAFSGRAHDGGSGVVAKALSRRPVVRPCARQAVATRKMRIDVTPERIRGLPPPLLLDLVHERGRVVGQDE